MSQHDRGAFGELLARAKAAGVRDIIFACALDAPDESDGRWQVDTMTRGIDHCAFGRTGEEALRRFVEQLESCERCKSGQIPDSDVKLERG